MSWRNFSIWYGRLPHWRADDVTYYVTFRHRRPLKPEERDALLNALLRPDQRRWDLLAVCVLPEVTEGLLRVCVDPQGAPIELSKTLEKAKGAAAKRIQKQTGERFSPFFTESYDRIVRDEDELEARWQSLVDAPVRVELAEDADAYPHLWVSGRD